MHFMALPPLFPHSLHFVPRMYEFKRRAFDPNNYHAVDCARQEWAQSNDVFCGLCPPPVTTVLLIAPNAPKTRKAGSGSAVLESEGFAPAGRNQLCWFRLLWSEWAQSNDVFLPISLRQKNCVGAAMQGISLPQSSLRDASSLVRGRQETIGRNLAFL